MAMRLTERSVKAVSAGVTATSLTSCVTVTISAPIAVWALVPPHQLSRLLVAIGVLATSIAIGLLVGRGVARRVRARLVARTAG